MREHHWIWHERLTQRRADTPSSEQWQDSIELPVDDMLISKVGKYTIQIILMHVPCFRIQAESTMCGLPKPRLKRLSFGNLGHGNWGWIIQSSSMWPGCSKDEALQFGTRLPIYIITILHRCFWQNGALGVCFLHPGLWEGKATAAVLQASQKKVKADIRTYVSVAVINSTTLVVRCENSSVHVW